MKSMPRPSVKPQQPTFWSRLHLSPQRQREILGLALFALGVLGALSLFKITRAPGIDLLSQSLRTMFGWGAFALTLVFFWAAWSLMRRDETASNSFSWGRIFAVEIFFAVALGLVHQIIPSPDPVNFAANGNGGGMIGYTLSHLASVYLGDTLTALIFGLILLLALPGVIGLSSAHFLGWSESLSQRAEQTRQSAEIPPTPIPPLPSLVRGVGGVGGIAPSRTATQLKLPKPPPIETKPPPRPGFGVKPPVKTAVTEAQVILTSRERTKKRITLPPIDLLDPDSHTRYGETDANRKARLIEETLAQFGIPARIVEVNSGPTITQFGLEPGFVERRGTDGTSKPRKVSVNRIAALQHDLELALASSPIRIETPVPGRNIVGIEVPNENVSLVSLRGILESEPYKKKKSALRIALGRDVSGGSIVSDLETMPHLLIAGATGSGKSVCINAIIACLLFGNAPEKLRLIMIDPKRVELTPFNGIPHLLGPVVVDMSEVVPALRWVTREMDNRFSLFAKEKVRNIDSFNDKMEKANGPQMPYLLVLVDELADLMLIAAEDTEKLLTRLAQLARATGIHLVLATQRPSVDVVTGLIKANFPARISFAVTSSVDSRVVLDMPGAEKLLGRGDMLYMASDSSKLSRLQGCFVSDDELARLVRFWRNKIEDDGYDIAKEPPWKGMTDAKEGSDEDLIAQAAVMAQPLERISISLMQRKLGIGYPRAARLMDQLEERGVVGADEGGGKPRLVLRAEEKTKDKDAKRKK